MIIDMTGGASLNFNVAAYADEKSLLSDVPGVNTIGVVTSMGFTGWHFSQEEPAVKEEGLLWFRTGDALYSDAAFSAVPGNTIMVYPMSAFQYRSDSWEEIPVWSYMEKDGIETWVEWIKQKVWLVKDGVLAIQFDLDSTGRMSVTQQEGSVLFQSSTNGGYGTVELDLTHYSKLVVKGTKFSSHGSNKVGVWEKGVTPTSTNATVGASFKSSKGKTELDVSELSGVYNVGLLLLGGTTYNAVVTEFYLARS